MSLFNYLIDKLEAAETAQDPYGHVIIDNFLNDHHFLEISQCNDLLVQATSVEELLDMLEERSYKSLDFPGCTPSRRKYLSARNAGRTKTNIYEGIGYALRKNAFSDDLLHELDTFLSSDAWADAVCKKFNIQETVSIDAGLQKYLSGYEIAPHPDIRAKAATWMLNINNHPNSEKQQIHTHLMRFKDRYKYIYDLWEFNLDLDRAWVPWEWCETVKKTATNNSIILFSPNNHTLHAVRCIYDDLNFQRTQFYGNLWYPENRFSSLKYVTHQYLDVPTNSAGIKPYAKKRNHVDLKGKSFFSKIFK